MKKSKKAAKPATKNKAKATAKPKPVAKPALKPVLKPAVKSAGRKPVVAERGKPKPSEAPPVAPAPKKVKLTKDQANRFKKLLLDLRDHLIDGVNFLASENLKRTNRDASGELSGYSLHMADAGTDNFDREFALSLVSSEQEALYEITEALKRLEGGTYGGCEMCEKPIVLERLEAVPFARLCVQCQSQMERDRRGQIVRAGPTFTEDAEGEGGEAEEPEKEE